MRNVFGLVGAGGYGREVMEFAKRLLPDNYEIYFVETVPRSDIVNGVRVISETEFLSLPARLHYAVAVASREGRRQIVSRVGETARPYSLVASNCFVGESNNIGAGAILSPFSTVTANAKIGQHFHANLYSYVAHDCVIGDFVTFAPNVHCNGNVHIGDGAYIGTGAVIRQGDQDAPMTIGRNAVIGMGAVVTKPVPDGATVVGNPARPMIRP